MFDPEFIGEYGEGKTENKQEKKIPYKLRPDLKLVSSYDILGYSLNLIWKTFIFQQRKSLSEKC